MKQSCKPANRSMGSGRILGAILFGLVFGFLLQKGGVGKYNVLIGQLLLQDYTVIRIMMSAVVVGMLGVFILHHFAKVNLHLQPTKLVAQIIGGSLFGAGFALLAYCPGTGAAALGQGSWDVLFGFVGLIAGSYLFAEMSDFLERTIGKWGVKGKLMLPDLVKLPRLPFALGFAALLSVFLYFLDRVQAC
ncbi:YeeE/YedE thiosulfate transporter family protein (plasmid) [Verrucomicrobiaceae bacterium 227]